MYPDPDYRSFATDGDFDDLDSEQEEDIELVLNEKSRHDREMEAVYEVGDLTYLTEDTAYDSGVSRTAEDWAEVPGFHVEELEDAELSVTIPADYDGPEEDLPEVKDYQEELARVHAAADAFFEDIRTTGLRMADGANKGLRANAGLAVARMYYSIPGKKRHAYETAVREMDSSMETMTNIGSLRRMVQDLEKEFGDKVFASDRDKRREMNRRAAIARRDAEKAKAATEKAEQAAKAPRKTNTRKPKPQGKTQGKGKKIS